MFDFDSVLMIIIILILIIIIALLKSLSSKDSSEISDLLLNNLFATESLTADDINQILRYS